MSDATARGCSTLGAEPRYNHYGLPGQSRPKLQLVAYTEIVLGIVTSKTQPRRLLYPKARHKVKVSHLGGAADDA